MIVGGLLLIPPQTVQSEICPKITAVTKMNGEHKKKKEGILFLFDLRNFSLAVKWHVSYNNELLLFSFFLFFFFFDRLCFQAVVLKLDFLVWLDFIVKGTILRWRKSGFV